jgi:Filamin/ABP280 repeat
MFSASRSRRDSLLFRCIFSAQVALGCCQASGSGLTSALAGQECSFRIAAHDANGNPIMTGGAKFTVKVTCEGDTGLTLLCQSTGLVEVVCERCFVSSEPGNNQPLSSANSSARHRSRIFETMLMLQARR